MSTETARFTANPSLDGSSTVQPALLLRNRFTPEFLSLAIIDQGNYCRNEVHVATPTIDSLDNASNQNFSLGGDTNRLHIHHGQVQPSSRGIKRKNSADMHIDLSLETTQSHGLSSLRSANLEQPHFGFNHSPSSARHSDLSSTNSSSSPMYVLDREETLKRERHLERNRAAASKSRQKKKRETDQLKNRYQEVSNRKKELEWEVKTLHSKLLTLKDELLEHSYCGDEAIRLYLGQMAKQAATQEAESSVPMHTQTTPPKPEHTMLPQPPVAVGRHSPGQPRLPKIEDTSGFSCGNLEKTVMDDLLAQPARNVFDYQISIP
ncbi:hypothetical protein P175DRAFT_0495316 [Aspergillus ochraceoroseus IBT 24754]|uniref:BZIP domain-containing protein n=3 Tax=Aspergillus subgen. Nidulantes TaxID=2720870 RepID=A0A0F8XQ82_9EURO|nr:uncharacterized protein P175DRAFT_0495316 [Aspergillus ochraceoroseus IBT 24754]KKK14654.1 hypothetical protein AOCH_001090 [Aspergillus ochraceoroseus]KKK25672.1 hypothetical protein ARAM_003718 [Aspergillus rambellii]PTU18981.1 hypothetical protein P175DRAFT_0495316 [Aspergillus ochraceoroseus IBT 24754]